MRRWTVDDLPGLDAVVSRNVEHLRPWMPWVAGEPVSTDGRRDLVELWERQWEAGGDVVLAMVLDGQFVGSTGLHRRRGPNGLEIGYWVDKDHLGRGLATEAASVLTDAALSLPDIDFVEIHHDKANERSALIPRRLGYRLVGETADSVDAPGEVGIDCQWRITAAEWRAR
ncbi:MAG: GNAT family N-acetyltransferase [Acidimicrobiales bacterium]